MIRSNPGVRRPFLYVIAAVFGIAVAVPLAVTSGQTRTSGIFDECFAASCDGLTMVAEAGE